MNEHDDITQRLRALGEQPVDPAVRSAHLSALAAPRRSWFEARRVRTAGAFLAGLLLGGTGLASAGALPAPVQNVAHTTLGAVGVSVPRAQRHQGPECGGTVKNHGQYVKAQPKGQRSTAAHSQCGMPTSSNGEPGNGPATPGSVDCQGPPPWAGQGHGRDKAAKQAAQAQRRATCGSGSDAGAADDDAGTARGGDGTDTTATTAAPTTSSTTTTTTTTPPTTSTAPPTTVTTLGEVLPVPGS